MAPQPSSVVDPLSVSFNDQGPTQSPQSESTKRHDNQHPHDRSRRDPTDDALRQTPAQEHGETSSRADIMFPPLPDYRSRSIRVRVLSLFFRFTSSILSLCFLLSLVFGMLVSSVPKVTRRMLSRLRLKDPDNHRPFYAEEKQRAQHRKAAEKAWLKQKKYQGTQNPSGEKGLPNVHDMNTLFVPTEGGPDPLLVDVAYYARCVGLDCETFEVQTEDGFIIELWHLYNPLEQRPASPQARGTLSSAETPEKSQPFQDGNKRYPVLMVHGLLQSAGAFCTTDDDSLAFYLAESGYDVWLGNNRCGFKPRHATLHYRDPKMWAWNIKQMGVFDLSALIDRVLLETGFPKLALIAHSQGTTETFVALAKDQRPELGSKISVFCALAPAVYAGPLIHKIYFRFMQLLPSLVFRLIFGIHAFIPVMMTAHDFLPARYYGWMGYHVFSFLFKWTDDRWDRAFRSRMFQWAPVYVSAESMRWWLGKDCFAKHKCILSPREETLQEDREDAEDDAILRSQTGGETELHSEVVDPQGGVSSLYQKLLPKDGSRARFAWYDERFPPLALWVCGSDDLVDGRRLLRRFERGREPHVRLVHQKVIPEYEHLDVIWAMDSIEKVGKDVREVIWRTVDSVSRARCRIPVGCSISVDGSTMGEEIFTHESEGAVR